MELEQLRIFCTVAACRSFTRAAGQLFVSHSTTSRAVSALERELGVPLLVRDRHTVALTLDSSLCVTAYEADAPDRGGGPAPAGRCACGRRAHRGGGGPGAARTAGGVILADCTNFFAKFLRLSEKPS